MQGIKRMAVIVSLFIGGLHAHSALAAIPLDSSGKPIAGQTAEQFTAYKRNCPECVKVAEDIVKMRTQFCRETPSVDYTILQDPIYPYLNSIRLLTQNAGGYNSTIYSSSRQIVEANVNCNDTSDWLERSKRVLSNTYNVSG